MNEEKYQRILNTIIEKAPIETGVQTLVFMLLDEIESEKNKNRKKEEKVSVLVADLRKGKTPIFGGEGGVVDLCVVNENFKYAKEPLNLNDKKCWKELSDNPKKINRILRAYDCWEEEQKIEKEKGIRRNELAKFRINRLKELNENWETNFIEQINNRRGCVEIKATSIQLPESENIDQIAGHILTYKKVIYTNGLVWIYFDVSEKKNVEKKNIENAIKENLRDIIENRFMVDKTKETELKNTAGYRWAIPLGVTKKGDVNNTEKVSITHTTNRENVVVDEDEFRELINKLNDINW